MDILKYILKKEVEDFELKVAIEALKKKINETTFDINASRLSGDALQGISCEQKDTLLYLR